MTQYSKDMALLLWQGKEVVNLHSAFLNELKHSCVRATLEGKPLDVGILAKRIDQLEAACCHIFDQTGITANDTAQ